MSGVEPRLVGASVRRRMAHGAVESNDDRSRGCAISNGAHGSTVLLPRLQRLPGFDHMAVAHARGSTANARFVVRRRWG